MAMFIVKPWYCKAVNPDDYFDPITHIATEENFIKFLQCGVYDSKYIGYKVQLSNSAGYNNGLWVIADVNHDSVNTGQTNCYDLISLNCFDSTIYGSSNNYWRNSNIRTKLNGNFYSGFSNNFKSHILNIKYNSEYTWYTDDKIIMPSWTELTGGYSDTIEKEGILYPIFSDNNSRKKFMFGSNTYQNWWSRTRVINYGTGYIWYVTNAGDGNFTSYSNSRYIVALLRVR